MKKMQYILPAFIAVLALSCTKSQFDDVELDSGTADFTTYISVGNSLTQGYQDGGLHNELQQQDNSFPAILARQMATNFVQPTVYGDGSGHKFLQSLSTSAEIIDVAADGGWDAGNPALGLAGTGHSSWSKTTKYNNLGVSGIRLTDCVASVGDPYSPAVNQVMTAFLNPYSSFLDLGIFGVSAPISYTEHIKSSNATFYTCWLGNNDVLGWSTSGGDDGATDAFTAYGLPTILTSELTPVTTFRTKYDSILDAFGSAKGVCATLPDVTSIPFFTTVPHNPIPMDATTAAATNEAYVAYNGGLDQMVLAGVIASAEGEQRKIAFTESETNTIVIYDEELTDLSGSGLPSIRQTTENDLILLSAASEIGRFLIEGNSATAYGIAVPFADSLVLTATEVSEVTMHTALLNNAIVASAAAHGAALVDMSAYMVELKSGLIFDGVTYDAKYIEGGSFSLDGVHPNTRGYAIIANKFIESINAEFGSNLRPVPVQNYRGIVFP